MIEMDMSMSAVSAARSMREKISTHWARVIAQPASTPTILSALIDGDLNIEKSASLILKATKKSSRVQTSLKSGAFFWFLAVNSSAMINCACEIQESQICAFSPAINMFASRFSRPQNEHLSPVLVMIFILVHSCFLPGSHRSCHIILPPLMSSSNPGRHLSGFFYRVYQNVKKWSHKALSLASGSLWQ